jgi:hypothetical protein|tara:strand:+ start:55 stop:462 length:408 start_codon:yes stop_codon:yes gene_type:complete
MVAKWKRVPFGNCLSSLTKVLNNHNVEYEIHWGQHRVLIYQYSVPSWLYFPSAQRYTEWYEGYKERLHAGIEATPYQFLKQVQLTKKDTAKQQKVLDASDAERVAMSEGLSDAFCDPISGHSYMSTIGHVPGYRD